MLATNKNGEISTIATNSSVDCCSVDGKKATIRAGEELVGVIRREDNLELKLKLMPLQVS